jgi:hypothetical protein
MEDIYNFESDDEDHINGYELSDLSDVFTDDEEESCDTMKVDELIENTVSTKIEILTKATAQSLSLDDIPYDRDLKWMNVPTSSRIKSNAIAPSRFLKQVQSIAAENAKDSEALEKHYIDMDILKRNHDNKTLFELPTPVRGDKRLDRDSRRRSERERRPRERTRNNRSSTAGPDQANDDADYDRGNGNENGRTLYVNKSTPTKGADDQPNRSSAYIIHRNSTSVRSNDPKPPGGNTTGGGGQNAAGYNAGYRFNPDSNDRNQGYAVKSSTNASSGDMQQQQGGRQDRQERQPSSSKLYPQHNAPMAIPPPPPPPPATAAWLLALNCNLKMYC